MPLIKRNSVEKHGNEIKQLGFEVEDFIPIIVKAGSKVKANQPNRIVLESETFRTVLTTKWNETEKIFVLTAFDLIKK
jgi:hypothetical protein